MVSRTFKRDTISELSISSQIDDQFRDLKGPVYDLSFGTTGREYKLEIWKTVIIARMLKELVQNVLTHAEASAVNVKLQFTHSNMIIRFADNGRGFSLTEVENRSNGLNNLKRRCSILQAQIDIHSKQGFGTVVKIILPVENVSEEET